MNLVRITKDGQPTLRIHPDALDEHKRLGWREAPDAEPLEPPAVAELFDEGNALQGRVAIAEALTPIFGPPVPDAFDAMSDEDLRAFIAERDAKAPHHKAGRAKLLAAARGNA